MTLALNHWSGMLYSSRDLLWRLKVQLVAAVEDIHLPVDASHVAEMASLCSWICSSFSSSLSPLLMSAGRVMASLTAGHGNATLLPFIHGLKRLKRDELLLKGL